MHESESDKIDITTSNNNKNNSPSDPKLSESIQLKDKGNKFFKAGKYQEAINFYQKALDVAGESYPDHKSICHQNMAVCYENTKDYSVALENCHAAIKFNPKYKKAFMRRSSVYKNMKNYQDAFYDSVYFTFLEKYTNFEAIMNMDELMQLLSSELAEKESINISYDLPTDATIGNYMDNFILDPIFCSINEYIRTSSKDENYYLSHDLNLISNLTNGDAHSTNSKENIQRLLRSISEAITLFKQKSFKSSFSLIKSELDNYNSYQDLIDDCEGNPRHLSHLALGHLLVYTFSVITANAAAGEKEFAQLVKIHKEGDFKADPAIDCLMKLIMSNAYIKKANAAISHEQDMDGCFSAFKKAQEICPESPDIYLHRGQIYFRSEDFDKAIEQFDKVTNDLKFKSGIAVALKIFSEHRKNLRNGDISKKNSLLSQLEKVVTDYPDSLETLSIYSNALIDCSEFSKAEEINLRIQEKYPDSPMGYFNHGLLYLHWKKDKQEIVNWMKKALEVDPKCESAIEILGQLCMEDGRFEEALDYFTPAISCCNNKNDIKRIIGYRESARAQLNICQKYNVDPKEIVECIQRMQMSLQ